MYSTNFLTHMYEKSCQLITIERTYPHPQRSKRTRAHQKLDYNLKRILDHLPRELREMEVGVLLGEYDGDLDLAAERVVKVQVSPLDEEKMYMSPPKNQNKKRNIKKKTTTGNN